MFFLCLFSIPFLLYAKKIRENPTILAVAAESENMKYLNSAQNSFLTELVSLVQEIPALLKKNFVIIRELIIK